MSSHRPPSSVEAMLTIFDVQPDEHGGFTGTSDGGNRAVVDGSQVLAQAIVAAAKTVPKRVRSAHAAFVRAVDVVSPIEFAVHVVHAGQTFAHVIVTACQGGRTCVEVMVLLDDPSPDVIRHGPANPAVPPPDAARRYDMPMVGRELRFVGLDDPNDPEIVGPPSIDAWLRYDPTPARDDLRRALLAHFTGHLAISAAMRGHAGIGTAMAHQQVSTAVITIGVTFHEPIDWDGWLLYRHDCTYAGAGMSFTQGQVFTEPGTLVASFTQEGMIRPFTRGAGTDRPPDARL